MIILVERSRALSSFDVGADGWDARHASVGCLPVFAVLPGRTVASGSLCPAVLCHLLANVPTALLAVQRATPGASS